MTDEVVAPDPAVIEPNTSGVVGVLAKALQGKLLLMIDSLLDEAEPANHAEDDFHAGVIAGLSQAHHVIRTMLPAELASVVAALPSIAIIEVPSVGYKAVGETDAQRYLNIACRIEDGYHVGGSNSRAAVAQLLRRVSDTLAARTAGGQG